MNREEELLNMIPEDYKPLVKDTVSAMVFLEERLVELKGYPFIQVNPKNPAQQRNTPAAKMYKEFLQQYLNCIKAVENIIYRDKRSEETVEESPLRKWFNAHIT